MEDELIERPVALPGGDLRILQPQGSIELPDDGDVGRAPLSPYWSVLWHSGVALAEVVAGEPRRGSRVVELGCGLGLPSLAAARAGADVLATDREPEAIELIERNAALNGLAIETALIDWSDPAALLERAPFDIVLAADLFYEFDAVEPLLTLLAELTSEVWLATPYRASAVGFLERAARSWRIETLPRGVVAVHRLLAGRCEGVD